MAPGLEFYSTDTIRKVLVRAAELHGWSEKDREAAAECSQEANGAPVSYNLLKAACQELQCREKDGLWLHQVLQGSQPILPKPKPRLKSAKLQARLAKLAAAAEERAYQELVADITKEEREESERQPFATYKDQLGLGLHVIFTMFTGYMVGWYAFRRLYKDDQVMHGMGGVLGLIGGMLLETVLFIIRASWAESKTSKED